MKTALFVATAAASVVASADAGFAGFVAFSRNVGANTVIDVFAAVDNAGDKFLNVYNSSSNGVFVQKAGLSSKTWKPDAANFTSTRSVSDDSFMTAGTFSGGSYGGEYYASGNTTADPNFTGTSWNGTFVQKAGLSNKTWKPDAANFTSTRSVSDDSFMTAGTFSGAAYGGEFYASGNSNGDPNFTGTSWNATLASPAATTIPNLAGWYTGDPPSVDNNAELLANAVAGGTRVDGSGAAGKSYGIWVSHLVVAGNNKVIGVDFSFSAFASIKDVGGAVSQASSAFAVPAPGAIALVGLAGLAAGRRRRA